VTNLNSQSTQDRNFKIQTDFGAPWSGARGHLYPLPLATPLPTTLKASKNGRKTSYISLL